MSVQGAAISLVLQLVCHFFESKCHVRTVTSVVNVLVFRGERVSRIELYRVAM